MAQTSAPSRSATSLPGPARRAWFVLPVLAIAALCLVRLSAASAGPFYVSPSGDDGNPGTFEQPFRTLEKARDAVRAIGPALTADVTVFLRGGIHTRLGTFALDAADSGRSGFAVIYRSYPGETAILSGGQAIGGWTREGDLWKAQAGPGRDARQLYVNGVRAIRARGAGALAGATLTATGYTTTDATLQHWTNVQDAEVVIDSLWRQFRCGIAAVAGGAMTLDQPCWTLVNSNDTHVREVDAVYVENALELLDTPGEWYLNRQTGWLYYWPRPGENMTTADVVLPVVETIVSAAGTPGAPIHHVRFEGIEFLYAGWTKPSTTEGFAESQANWAITSAGVRRMPAAVEVRNSESVVFERNVFEHLGGAGLGLGGGSLEDIVSGNRFHDISGTGLIVGEIDTAHATDPGAIPRNNQIANNYIHAVAVEYASGIGLFIGYAQGTLVAHNELHDLPYTAISIGWGWGRDDPSIARDNRIQHNLIYDSVRAVFDGGGIYSLSAQPGNVYSANVMLEQYGEYGAMYLDNGARYITVSDNVIFGNRRTALIKSGTIGGDHYIHDNWWQDRYPNDIWYLEDVHSYISGTPGPNRIENNRLIGSLTDAPAAILASAGIETAYRDIRGSDPLPSSSPSPSPVLPATPADLRAARTATGDKATVSWSPAKHARSYLLRIDNLTTGAREIDAEVAVTAYTHAVVRGQAYRFVVQARNPLFGDGDAAMSTTYSFGTPVLSPLAAQTTYQNSPTPPMSLTITGVDASASNVTVTASSSNPVLVPAASIAFGGSGANRTLTVFPATNQVGSATITVTASDGGASTSTSFPLTVAGPSIALDRASLQFAATCTGSVCPHQTGSQSTRLLQRGPGVITWTAVPTAPWIAVSPSFGTGSATLHITVDPGAGPPGLSSRGSVALSFVGTLNPPSQIAVGLRTIQDGASGSPVGAIDLPVDGTAGITGSVAVTGWALDDVGISAVRLLRDPVAPEPPGRLVFIGNATRVEGARPDVAAVFPDAPDNARGGWGYLMLTNFLPNRGNGTYRIHAFADDEDGHSTLLGTKTISCANAQAITPFGAIDTPGPGETVGGIVDNFGWVLAAGARRVDPLHGGSVNVVIDGQFVGSPIGWVARPDLTALFPSVEFPGISSALGVFTFDSTTLPDGLHTIAWVITDDQGHAAGIGSRFFTVANGGR